MAPFGSTFCALRAERREYTSVLLQPEVGLAIFLSFLEQLCVYSCTFEDDAVNVGFVNQEPIRFNMALPSPLPVSGQFMISMDGVKLLFLDQAPDYDFELLEIFTPPLDPLDVSFKLPCINWSEH